MNIKFQNLKALYLRTEGEEKQSLLSQMRENLKKRNNGEAQYTNQYTHPGEIIDIETCDDYQLFEIDGDMITHEY